MPVCGQLSFLNNIISIMKWKAMAKATWYFDFISPFAYLQLACFSKLRKSLDITVNPIVFGGYWQVNYFRVRNWLCLVGIDGVFKYSSANTTLSVQLTCQYAVGPLPAPRAGLWWVTWQLSILSFFYRCPPGCFIWPTTSAGHKGLEWYCCAIWLDCWRAMSDCFRNQRAACSRASPRSLSPWPSQCCCLPWIFVSGVRWPGRQYYLCYLPPRLWLP